MDCIRLGWTSSAYLDGFAWRDSGGVSKSKALSPSTGAEDRDSSAIIAYCKKLVVGAKLTQPYSWLQGGIVPSFDLAPVNGADELPVRSVKQ